MVDGIRSGLSGRMEESGREIGRKSAWEARFVKANGRWLGRFAVA
jgi:hypothetical protein